MRKLPPLNAIRSFEAVARHLSLSKAARELHVTPGAVSRAVAHLENSLQQSLLNRHKRRLQLTQAGQAYFERISQSLNSLAQATEELLEHQGVGGHLRLGVLPTLATRWLIPRLADFDRQCPGISVELKTVESDFSLSLAEIDFEKLGLDAALYYGDGNWPGVIADSLWQERLVPILHTSLLAKGKEKIRAQDIQKLPLLLHTTRPQAWQQWASAHHLDDWSPRWKARFEHYDMVIQACIAGMGVGLVPELLVQDALKQGHLSALSQLAVARPEGYYLLYLPSAAQMPKVRDFREWLLGASGDHPVL